MHTHKESAIYIRLLEARLAANPRSPSFAHLAGLYLKDGNTEKAQQICIEGLRLFPHYATAHLLLAQCYEAAGRNIEAMLEYRRVLKDMPDNRTVQTLLERSEQKEQEAFRNFSERHAVKLREGNESIPFERYATEEAEQKESTAEFLLKRLQNVRKPVPSPAAGATSPQEEPPPVSPSKIVTATLAEIYAAQGEYGEAIEAYKKLVSQRPIEADRYAKRIAQLEELSKVQQSEHQG